MPQTRFSTSIHGWRFSNSLFPEYRYRLPIFPYTRWGKSERGLCGGMVFSALDYYLAQKPIPLTEHLDTNDTNPLFRYLVKRLFDSFSPSDVSRYYQLQHPWCSRQNLYIHSKRHLQLILASLDRGIPVPFTLILVQTWNPDRLGENHQVLACGYDTQHETIRIRIYDPNYPGTDRYIQYSEKPGNYPLITMHGQSIHALHKMRYTPQNPPRN